MKSWASVCAVLVLAGLFAWRMFGSGESENLELRQHIAALERELVEAKSFKTGVTDSKPRPGPIDAPSRAAVPASAGVTGNELSPDEQALLDELNVHRFQRMAARQYG